MNTQDNKDTTGLTRKQVEIVKSMMFVFLRNKYSKLSSQSHKDIVAHMEYLLDDYTT